MTSKKWLIAALALLPMGVAVGRAAMVPREAVTIQAASKFEPNERATTERLAAALRLETVSDGEGHFRSEPFGRLHDLLKRRFPLAHGRLTREVVGKAGLLYRWPGSDTGKQPLLLMAHQDVVPVPDAREWTYPPFSGAILDGFVWGRGAIDDKSSVMATLEAVERLLTEGFRPSRTIYLAFGHDEEVGGHDGSQRIARLLKQRGVTLDLVLDEGLAVTKGLLPGVVRPVAMVGVAEKGFVSVELTTKGEGGHASMPPRQTAVGVLSQAIQRLEGHPMAARPVWAHRFFERVAADMPFGLRLGFANLWLSAPLVDWVLSQGPSTNAMLRTTTAATMFQAGIKENVLPPAARAVVNFRIIPGDTIADVLAHVKRVVGDERVTIRSLPGILSEPSPVSPTDSDGYRTLETSIRQVFTEATVAPSLVVGATDSRHFAPLSRQVYRFFPFELEPADLKRLHGKDERISVANYLRAIRFYRQFLINAAG